MSDRPPDDRVPPGDPSEPPDPYDVLEIPPSADPATVRRAYQRLARRHHPELQPDDPEAAERFARIHRAYRQLVEPPRSPPVRRRSGTLRYRRTVLTVRSSRPDRPGSREQAADPLRGLDLEQELHLDFAEAVRGATVSVAVERECPCPACARGGRTGCGHCGGRGEVVELDRVRVRLPAGVEDGARLRLRGKGRVARRGEAGDLHLVVRVAEHPFFRRVGRDVHCEIPVTYREAALGADIEVPTIDGPVPVRLPAGTSGGQGFRLRGRGIPTPDGARGDQFYRVRIVVPSPLDRESRELIERLPRRDVRADLPNEPL